MTPVWYASFSALISRVMYIMLGLKRNEMKCMSVSAAALFQGTNTNHSTNPAVKGTKSLTSLSHIYLCSTLLPLTTCPLPVHTHTYFLLHTHAHIVSMQRSRLVSSPSLSN